MKVYELMSLLAKEKADTEVLVIARNIKQSVGVEKIEAEGEGFFTIVAADVELEDGK